MTEFFNQLDTIRMLERNSNKIEGFELGSARKLIREYQTAKDQIKQDLLLAQSGSFTEAKLKTTMIQLDQAIAILQTKIVEKSKDFSDDAFEFGLDDSIREVNEFEKKFTGINNPIDIDSVIASTDKSEFLFNRFESSISAYNAQLRVGFQDSLTQSLLQQKTWLQTVWDMDDVFNQSEYVLARIVRTELHNIYSGAKFNGFLTVRDQYIQDLKKSLYQPMDSRTGEDSKVAARLHLVAELDRPFIYEYNGKTREFMFPPDRPNDRSILVPYRDNYSSSK